MTDVKYCDGTNREGKFGNAIELSPERNTVTDDFNILTDVQATHHNADR